MNLLNKLLGRDDSILEKACDENTLPKELSKLSISKDKEIRSEVANNSNCPTEVLMKLANDEESTVRLNVARNLNCPTDALEKLAKDDDRLTRFYLAENPNCSTEILELLKDDKDDGVKDNARHSLFRRNPKLIDQSFNSGNDIELRAIAGFKGTQEKMLKDLALNINIDSLIRRKAIESHNLLNNSLKEIYDKYKGTEDFDLLDIANSLSANENCASDILTELSYHMSSETREYVATNPNSSLNILEKLISDESTIVKDEALKSLIRRKEGPKDELIKILENIILNLTADGERVGEVFEIDVVSGLTQEDIDYYKDEASKRIIELKG